MPNQSVEGVLALHEEQLHVEVSPITDITTLKTKTESRQEAIDLSLLSVDAKIERIPVDELVDEIPQVRQEGDTTIIPICEEVMIKRVKIVEEIRITHTKHHEQYKNVVTLRKETIDISTKKGKRQ